MSLPKPYYQDDYVTLYHGDCREIVPELEMFDLLLTDPPYGIGADADMYRRRGKRYGRAKVAKTDYGQSDWDKEPVDKATLDFIRKKSKLIIVWGGNYFHLPPSRGWFVWDKKINGDFADCELAWTNLKSSVRIFRHMWNGMLRDGEARNEKRVHPTQKPVELMRWCINKAGGPEIKTILDPFAGSGTTGRAAKDLRRKCTLIEQEERYCEIAAKRMSQEVLAL